MAWADSEHNAIVKLLAVVCELTGTVLSDAAIQVMVKSLTAYPAKGVHEALNRCAQECKGRLALADIVQRIDDGRPGPESAWALMPKDEATGALVTREMAEAWGAAAQIYAEGDRIGARMAFLEHYRKAIATARAAGQAPHWWVSAGTSKATNEAAAVDGYRRGLITREQAQNYALPEVLDNTRALPAAQQKALTAATQDPAALAAGAAVRPDSTRILGAALMAPKCPDPDCAGCKAVARFAERLHERVGRQGRNPRHPSEVES